MEKRITRSTSSEITRSRHADNGSAILTEDKLGDFSKLYKKHYSTKDKKLIEAVKITQQILLGNTTLEEEVAKLEAKTKGRSSQKSTNKKSGTKRPVSTGPGASTEADDRTGTSISKALPRTSTIDFDELDDLKAKFKTNFFEENLSLEPGASATQGELGSGNYAAIRKVEQNLHVHTKEILDAVMSDFKLPESRIERMRSTIFQIGGMTFKFAALTTSWIGRYLKIMEFLLTHDKNNSVNPSLN